MPGPLSRRRRADRPARPQHAVRKVPERLQGETTRGSRGRASCCSTRAYEAGSAERHRDFRCASPSEEHSSPRETAAADCRGRETVSVAGGAVTAHIRGGGGPDDDVSDGEPACAAGRREEGASSFQASRPICHRRNHGVRRVAGEVRASASARSRCKACRQGGRRRAIDDDVRRAATQDPGSACRGGADAGAGCARGTACVA